MEKYKGLYVDACNDVHVKNADNNTIMEWFASDRFGTDECLVPCEVEISCSHEDMDTDCPTNYCANCVFNILNKVTTIEYLVEEGCITEGQALQFIMDTK